MELEKCNLGHMKKKWEQFISEKIFQYKLEKSINE